MKKLTKNLFVSLLTLTLIPGCSLFNGDNQNNNKDQSGEKSDFDILKENKHTPSDKIDVQLDPTTHKCVKIEVHCGTHTNIECWPYRCVDVSQFVDNIEITKEATATSNGSGVNHVTFNSIEIGRTYHKDVAFAIPATGNKTIKRSNENETIKEVSIENDVISQYLECDDLQSQYEYLKQTDKGVWEHPAKDYQEYIVSWKGTANREEYKVHLSLDPDFSSYITEDVTGTSFNYGFYVPGKTYYVRVIGDDYEHPIYTDSFKIKDNELRYVNVEGAQNMRDLGGWKTYDGKTVNYELLYRGANFNGSQLQTDVGTIIANGCGSGKLTQRGKEQMKEMGFQTEIDLRTPLSLEAYTAMKTLGTGRPSGEGDDGGQWMIGAGWNDDLDNLLQADMNGLMYEHLVSDSFMNYYKSIIQKVFDRLARKENYPVYFHCNAGADRTGTYGFLLNGLLGVQYNDLTKDYQLTSYSNGGGRRWRNKGNGERFYSITEIDESIPALKPGWQFDSYNTWDLLVRRLLERYDCESYIEKLGTSEEGNIIQVCLEKWLLEEGVTMQQIEAFRDIMLNADEYEDIKDQEFTIKLNNVPNKSEIKVHGGDTIPKLDTTRKGYVLTGFKDENGNEFNPYLRISKDMELTASYKAYCDDSGQESSTIFEWTTKKAKEIIKGNPDYQYDGCSAAFAEGVAQFMPRNEHCLDTTIGMPLIDYSSYGYVSFFATSIWSAATIYVDDYCLGAFEANKNTSNSRKAIIAISGSNVYVDGKFAYRLTNEQNTGLKPIKLRYVMSEYHKSATLAVSNISTKIVDYVSMAKSLAETLDNIVLGGFNTIKTLTNIVTMFNKYYAYCNDYEISLVNASEHALEIANSISGSTYKVTYRIWGEISSTEALLAEDILIKPAQDPQYKPFTFAYWGTDEGEFTGFNNTISEDITLDAYYEYTSGADGLKKYASKISTISYYCFPECGGYYGSNELTKAPENPTLPDGYTFLRWTSNIDTMEGFEFGGHIDNDVTLYAVAKDASGNELIFKNIYHITFKDALGIGSDKVVDVFEEEQVSKLEGPANESYPFAFWGFNDKEFKFDTPITSDLTLYPYYWQDSSNITPDYYTVLEMDKQMDVLAELNPTETTGWVPSSSNGQYIAVVSSGFMEFGMRKANTAKYVLNLPKFDFSQYECVSFDIKNTWTAASFKINGVSVSDSNIGVSTAFKVIIRGNKLSVIVANEEKTLINNLDDAIVHGLASLVIEATDSTNGNGGGSFDVYNFLAYRVPVTLN